MTERTRTLHAKSSWSNGLLSVWVALIGADRIDLAGGQLGFGVTPFLALTPLVIVSEIVRRRLSGERVAVSRALIVFAILTLTLISASAASVFVSPVPSTSAERAVLLAAQLFGCAWVALMVGEDDARREALARGAAAGLLIFLGFAIAEIAAFIGRIPETVDAGPVSISLSIWGYGGLIPRVAGAVFDANRGGPIVLFYLLLLGRSVSRKLRSPWWTALAVALMVATLSRSVLLCCAVTWGFLALERREIRFNRMVSALASLAATAVLLVLLVAPSLRNVFGTNLAPLLDRFSFAEGSSQSHVELLRRGLSDATESLSTVLLGHGYGSAYYYLQDMFPGSRYGNYHSLYVSMFAEAGVVALMACVLLLAVPLLWRNPYRSLVAGVIAYNLFYSLNTEPAFWTLLAFAWFSLQARPARVAPQPS